MYKILFNVKKWIAHKDHVDTRKCSYALGMTSTASSGNKTPASLMVF